MTQYQREHNENQQGDLKKAAPVIVFLVSLADPPLRLLLGSDAFHAAEHSDLLPMGSDRKWKDLTESTDFDKLLYVSWQRVLLFIGGIVVMRKMKFAFSWHCPNFVFER